MKLMNTNYCTEDATVITASSENTNFPASNLKHPFRSKRWRSTASTSESVVFDLVTTEAVDSVVILWPKEDGIRLSDSAVVKIQANATNVWTSPAVNQTLTINDVYMVASHYFSTDQSYRYWRVVVQDPGNAYGCVELGVVWIGKSLAIDNAQNGFKAALTDLSKSSKTDFGHVYVDQYPQLMQIDFSYQYLDYSVVQILEDAYRQNGNSKPVMLVLDAEGSVFDKDHFTVYGMFKNTFGLQHVRYNILNTDTLSVLELS
jgi:hypothetical protein